VQDPDVHRAIDAVWRIESPNLIGGLARIVRDVGIAEDLAQDALVAALEKWPATGVPGNPGAWLMATAKNRAIDLLRRRTMLDRKHDELGNDLASQDPPGPDGRGDPDDDVGNDVLRLVFIACHPILTNDARVALTLRLVGGLSTAEIAACHARARTASETDWPRIAALYADLARLAPSPVVELNRAVAVGMAAGPAAGLEILDELASDPALPGYHLLPAARAEMLERLGRPADARAEFERAASLTQNAAERTLLLARARPD
jgi:RNA polymerase sigma factor (sigma-70 family)